MSANKLIGDNSQVGIPLPRKYFSAMSDVTLKWRLMSSAPQAMKNRVT